MVDRRASQINKIALVIGLVNSIHANDEEIRTKSRTSDSYTELKEKLQLDTKLRDLGRIKLWAEEWQNS